MLVAPKEQGLSLFVAVSGAGNKGWLALQILPCRVFVAVAGFFAQRAHQLLYHFHFLTMYVDGLLAPFPAHCASVMASLSQLLAQLGRGTSLRQPEICTPAVSGRNLPACEAAAPGFVAAADALATSEVAGLDSWFVLPGLCLTSGNLR